MPGGPPCLSFFSALFLPPPLSLILIFFFFLVRIFAKCLSFFFPCLFTSQASPEVVTIRLEKTFLCPVRTDQKFLFHRQTERRGRRRRDKRQGDRREFFFSATPLGKTLSTFIRSATFLQKHCWMRNGERSSSVSGPWSSSLFPLSLRKVHLPLSLLSLSTSKHLTSRWTADDKKELHARH